MAGTDLAAQYARATGSAFEQRVHSALMRDVPNMLKNTGGYSGANADAYRALGRALCVAARRDTIVDTIAFLIAGQTNIYSADDAAISDTVVADEAKTAAKLLAEGGSY